MQASLLLLFGTQLLTLVTAAVTQQQQQQQQKLAPIYGPVSNDTAPSNGNIIVIASPPRPTTPPPTPSVPTPGPDNLSSGCSFERKRTSIEVHFGDCVATTKVKKCSGYTFSYDYVFYHNGYPGERRLAPKCTPTEYYIKPRRLEFDCSNGKKIQRRIFLSMPLNCVVAQQNYRTSNKPSLSLPPSQTTTDC